MLCREGRVLMSVVSPDGKLVAAGSLDTMVRVWNVQTGQQLERLKGHKDSVYRWVKKPMCAGALPGVWTDADCEIRSWGLDGKVGRRSRGQGQTEEEYGIGQGRLAWLPSWSWIWRQAAGGHHFVYPAQ